MIRPHTDSHPDVTTQPFGLGELIPCPTPELTWTCAGPVFEYAIRSALCGGLQVTAWPKMGAEWAFLVPPTSPAVCAAFHPGRIAAAAAGADRWAVRRRAKRILATSSEWAEGDVEGLDALQRGRVRAVLGERLAEDLLLTSARLRDVAFRVWSHHAHVAAAEWAVEGNPTPEALASTLVHCGPLPLWGTEIAGSVAPRARGSTAGFADTLRTAFSEIRVLVDDLARRGEEIGVLRTAVDIVDRDWNSLPALVAGLDATPA